MPESANRQGLFTITLDLEGTKAAAQYRADSLQHALQLWSEDLSLPGSYGLTNFQREKLAETVSAFGVGLDAAPPEGNPATWGLTISAEGRGIGLLNIIETMPIGTEPVD